MWTCFGVLQTSPKHCKDTYITPINNKPNKGRTDEHRKHKHEKNGKKELEDKIKHYKTEQKHFNRIKSEGKEKKVNENIYEHFFHSFTRVVLAINLFGEISTVFLFIHFRLCFIKMGSEKK